MVLELVNDAFHTLKPYVPGKPVEELEREFGIRGAVKLASNENPLGPSPLAMEAIRSFTAYHEYPDADTFVLREALAARHGVPRAQLLVGNGSNEIVELMIRTLVRPDENMIYVRSSFIAYLLCAQAAGIAIREVSLTAGLEYDLDAIAAAVDARTKLIFLPNPNNPTGTYFGRQAFASFLRQIPESVVVVVDEAYFEYADAPDYFAAQELFAGRDRWAVLRTFSKCYGLAALRVGYAVGPAELIGFLNRGRQPFNVNAVALTAATAALEDRQHVAASVAQNATERLRVSEGLAALELRVTPSQGNFVLVDTGRPAGPVYDALLRRGVIVRPVGGYGLPTHLRISIGTEAQNDRMLGAVTEVLGRDG